MNAIRYSVLCGLAVSSLLAGACTRAQAKVVPEMPPLDVPAPPPRYVEAVEVEPPAPPPPPEDPAPATPVKPPATPTVQQKPDPPRPEPPKVEVAVPEPPKPAEESKPQGTLQTQPAAREAQLERTIRDMLNRATSNLNRVDYGALNADAKTQYDQAKRFISQAQDALRDKNLVFADNLADKANTLAAQLSGR